MEIKTYGIINWVLELPFFPISSFFNNAMNLFDEKISHPKNNNNFQPNQEVNKSHRRIIKIKLSRFNSINITKFGEKITVLLPFFTLLLKQITEF